MRHSDLSSANDEIVCETRRQPTVGLTTARKQDFDTHRRPDPGTVRRLSTTRNFVNDDARSANLQGLTARAMAATSKVPLLVLRYRGKMDDRF